MTSGRIILKILKTVSEIKHIKASLTINKFQVKNRLKMQRERLRNLLKIKKCKLSIFHIKYVPFCFNFLNAAP